MRGAEYVSLLFPGRTLRLDGSRATLRLRPTRAHYGIRDRGASEKIYPNEP